MTNEIKEILDEMINLNDYEYYKIYGKRVNEIGQLLLDYITNLQEKVNQYENPDDLTLFYMWLDVKAKDKMKELEDNLYSANQVVNELLDVKEENERLKELCDKYEEEHSTTFNYWKQLIKENYKSRNEKAIELINTWLEGLNNDDIIILLNDLGNILKGSE